MKTVSLSGSLRENVGKKDAKMQRNLGKVPCVIYGGKEQKHFTLNQLDFKKIVFTPDVFIVKIELDGSFYETILQEVQYHPVTDIVLHADFLQITPGKQIVLGIPVELEGTSPGIIKGGKLHLKLRKLRVRGLVEDMPERILINVSKLDLGKSIKVKEIVNNKLQFLDTANSVIVNVKTPRGIVEEESEEGEEGEEGEAGEAGEEKSEA